MSDGDFWRRCSSCKTKLDFDVTYWVCNVSTCNRKRTGLYFCSVSCWEAHLPLMRHRESWAVETRSPGRAAWQREVAKTATAAAPTAPVAARVTASATPRAVVTRAATPAPAPAPPARRLIASDEDDADLPRDILVVVSKLKKYIKARSGMNTSDSVVDVLSDHVRRLADEAIRSAAENERKTVLDRDFPSARTRR